MQMNERHVKAQSFDAANTERLRQIAEESDMLVTMAMALKAEADNSNSDGVSPTAIRKAETIEKLAHSVKQKMELTVGELRPSGDGAGSARPIKIDPEIASAAVYQRAVQRR